MADEKKSEVHMTNELGSTNDCYVGYVLNGDHVAMLKVLKKSYEISKGLKLD